MFYGVSQCSTLLVKVARGWGREGGVCAQKQSNQSNQDYIRTLVIKHQNLSNTCAEFR